MEMKKVYIVRHGESLYNVRKNEARAIARAIMTLNHLTQSQLQRASYSVIVDVDRDPSLHDCSLTNNGFNQAQALSNQLKELKIDVVVTSPLRRCIQTMLASNILETKENEIKEVVVNPLCTERLEGSCDWGNFPDDLENEFPRLKFSNLPKIWWYHPKEVQFPVNSGSEWTQQLKESHWKKVFEFRKEDGYIEDKEYFDRRVEEFKKWIKERKETNFLVFAHQDFFHQFTGYWKDGIFFGQKLENCELYTMHI